MMLVLSLVASIWFFAGTSLARADAPSAKMALSAGALSYSTPPNLPDDWSVTLNGDDRAVNKTMPTWSVVDATGSGAGWTLSVAGDTDSGKSPVFKAYCSDNAAANGCNGYGPGYSPAGPVMSTGSLKLDSGGASFSATAGTTGTAPSHACGSLCSVDTGGSTVTVASATTNTGMGTWEAASYSATSLSLAVPYDAAVLDQAGAGNKYYKVDLVWTLATGP